MNEIPTIAERLVTYYNDLIKNNVIAGEASVTLEWMKRQRILEGRNELDLRFGSVTVDSVLGEKTPLAKAEQYLVDVRKYNKYELLPTIASLLAKECNTMLGTDNIARKKYSSLGYCVTIPTIDIKSVQITLSGMLNTSDRKVTLDSLKYISSFISMHNNVTDDYYSDVCFCIYIMNVVYITLSKAFNEIKEQVECITNRI